MKVAYSNHISGFMLSKKAFDMLLEMNHPGALEELEVVMDIESWGTDKFDPLPGWLVNDVYYKTYSGCYIDRNDPSLIRVIEELGQEATVPDRTITINEIPDDADWYILDDDDGSEHLIIRNT